MLSKNWKKIMISAFIINLISIKGFPMAIGAVYLPILFKIIKMQMNLSKGLVDQVNPKTFIKSNQTGIIVSVVCCIVISILLLQPLHGFYSSLDGFLATLITISPVTMILGAILLILTAMAIIQAAKAHYAQEVLNKEQA